MKGPLLSWILLFLQWTWLCAAGREVRVSPALFVSYNLVPGLKPSVSHSEQLPFTEAEADVYLTRSLEQCLNDHYIFVRIPGLQVEDFQNFTVWHHLRNRLTQASTILSMPNVLDNRGVVMSPKDQHSVIHWDDLQRVLETHCHIDQYNVSHMDEEEVPNFMDTHKKLINIEAPQVLLYQKDTAKREKFLMKIDELIRRICMKFPSPRVGVVLAGTTSMEVDYSSISNREDVVEYHHIPDDPKVLSVSLREKVKTSKRFIFPDITVFDKTRYHEFERNEFGETHRLSDLKDKQWAKDGDKNPVDVEDDTWLERKKKVIVKEQSLYRYGEDETFHSALEDKQFVVDNAVWIACGVVLFFCFLALDFIKLVGKEVCKIIRGNEAAKTKEPVESKQSKPLNTRKLD